MRLEAMVVLLTLIPAVQAVEILTDEAGDVRIDPAGRDPSQYWSHADLLSLDVQETVAGFVMELGIGAPPEAGKNLLHDVDYTISFRHNTYAYEVRIYEGVITIGLGEYYRAELFRQTRPSETPRFVADLEMTANSAGGLLEVHVPKTFVRDANDEEPHSGRSLTDVRVTTDAYWVGWPLASQTIGDRMPDAGTGVIPVQLGMAQEGDIRLITDERIRGSNGEATTYFWRVQMENLNATVDHDVTLSLQDVPDSWIARLPLQEATVQANSTIDVPLLLTVPFAHQHGIIETLILEARSTIDASSVGRVQLGLEFLDPAQPAGHHDQVYLHTSSAQRPNYGVGGIGMIWTVGPSLSMNTLAQDASDRAVPVHGLTDLQSESRAMRTGWVVPLEPALRLGLDFDLDRQGSISVPLSSDVPQTDGILEGNLLLVPRAAVSQLPRDYDGFPGVTVLADILPTSVPSLDGDRVVVAPVAARPDGDFVPHNPEMTLAMVLWLHADGALPPTNEQAPQINPGGSMTLPLDEYHDPIDASFAAPDFLQVALKGATERVMAPGTALLWELHVKNGGARSLDLHATVQGKNADWVEFPADAYHVVDNETTGVVPFAIRAPSNAKAGDVADLVIEIADLEDPRIRGIVRVVATVANINSAGDIIPEQDQSAFVDAIENEHNSKRTPAIQLPLVLLGLLVISLRRIQ